ncbi:quinone oxidoreductase [Streptomyces sp. NPDC001941]|uniref:quinone oxidoreductase family protein n=1 Tax=Streptomyces sp. NPDC001941 TaxID=3154659 RepID=UPI00331A5E9C
MRAVRVHRAGGPETLTVEEVPEPVAGPGEVLVRHEAVGVNYLDVYFRDGTYPAEFPTGAGHEAAGTVLAAGEGVTGFAAGDRVAYAVHRGAYAEQAAVPAAKVVRVPEGVGAREAAAVLLQGLAAHYLAHDTYAVKPGDTVVVLAAAGGLGRLLVQLAAHRGATVIAVTSTPDKEKQALEAGAAHALPYEGFGAKVRELTGGAGAQAVYDSVGAPTWRDSLAALGRRGHLVLCGASGGPVPPLDTDLLRTNGSLYVTRPTLGDHIATPEELRERSARVFALVAEGVLRPAVSRELPLERAEEAHRLLEGRGTTGKLLLVP